MNAHETPTPTSHDGAGQTGFGLFERAVFALLGALATLLVFEFALWAGLDEHDAAKAGGPFGWLTDPFVLELAVPTTCFGAALAFALSFLWVRLVNPWKAALRTCQITWGATAIGAWGLGLMGLPIAFAALIVSSLACAAWRPWRRDQGDRSVAGNPVGIQGPDRKP